MFALQGRHLRKETQAIAPVENSLLLFRVPRSMYREEGLVTVSPCGLPKATARSSFQIENFLFLTRSRHRGSLIRVAFGSRNGFGVATLVQ